jgi:16S rRNA (cytidine1402-2'-O)-methyltransferase
MASESHKPGALYVVAMPIGNPDDLGARAKRILGEVDLIACEDTRRTGRMLAALEIRKPLVSYFDHNELRRAAELVERLKTGARIALVTDAGTPAISDPGYRLVRGAIEAGITVTPVAGPSAVAAALSISGLPSSRFTFEGFLPPKASARISRLKALSAEPRTMVFFEAARRLSATLAEMTTAFGADRRAAIFRELTKTWEETLRGTLGELARRFAADQARGEITIVVEGAPEDAECASDSGKIVRAEVTIELLLEAGLGLKEASAVIARLTNRSRREVYQEALRTRPHDADGGSS